MLYFFRRNEVYTPADRYCGRFLSLPQSPLSSIIALWEVVRGAKGEIILGDVDLTLTVEAVEKEKC